MVHSLSLASWTAILLVARIGVEILLLESEVFELLLVLADLLRDLVVVTLAHFLDDRACTWSHSLQLVLCFGRLAPLFSSELFFFIAVY